jgi:hypothetical protein
VPDAGPTEAVGLAWSVDDTTPADPFDNAPTERYSWPVAWLNVALVLVCAAVMAGVVGFGRWLWIRGRHTAPPRSPS